MTELQESDLLALSDEDFVAVWRVQLGEPPAILIDRPLMVSLLLDALMPPWGVSSDTDARRAA
jgi:hypothetical protein